MSHPQVSGFKFQVSLSGYPKHSTQPKTNARFWRDNAVRQHGDGHTAGVAPELLRRGECMRVPIGRKRSQIATNKARDRRVNSALSKRGWIVLRVCEHELRLKDESKLLRRSRAPDFALRKSLRLNLHRGIRG